MSNKTYKYWILAQKTVLVIAIITTTARWIVESKVPTILPGLLYMAVFSMHLISERVGGKSLPISEKAFCYFMSYLFSFFVLAHQLRVFCGQNVAARGAFLFLGVNAPLVTYQVIYFRRRAKDDKASDWVLFFGVLEIVVVIFCVWLYWMRCRGY